MNVHFPRGDTESPEDHGPKFDFRPGDIVRLGRPEGGYVRTLQYKGRIAASSATGFRPAEPSHLHFEAVPDASSVFLTDRDISFRAKAGEFEVVVATEQADKPRPQMLTNLSLTDTEAKVARRYKRYVDACLALGPDFRRSHLVLEPVIAKVAAELGEQPPSFSTVLRKFDQWCDMGGVYGTASLAPKRRKGNTSRPWSPRVLAMMRNCINRALQMPKGTARDAQAMLQAAVDEEYSETKSDIKLPALRTIEREFGKIDKYTRDFLRKGPGYAERKHAAYYERPRPELPLEEAEVDHTTFDIRLIDDESPLIFGRPIVTTIRDRRTGMILGMNIGWEAPSYASFLEAVRHALYEKDLNAFPSVRKGWPCRGRFKRLFVDNALEFVGLNIRHAANELGFEIVEFRPGQPWLKGAEERLFGLLNRNVAHLNAGTTLSNIAERKEHAERLEPPTLTLKEFEAFLVIYICDEYHYQKHEGLGPLRTLPDIPIRLWENEIGRVKIRDLPHPETIASLIGDVDERTVQHYGVEWDHIVYQSEELIAIRVHPEHKEGRGRHRGTRYRVVRDPQDLGRIWVIDPYRKIRVEVSAVRADYAVGLTLHQHRVIVAHHRRTVGQHVDEAALLRARGAMLIESERLRKQREAQGVEHNLARFLGKQKQKRFRSIVSTNNESAILSQTSLDIENPVALRKPELRSKRAPNLNRRGGVSDAARVRPFVTGDHGTPMLVDRGAAAVEKYQETWPSSADSAPVVAPAIDEIKKRHSDWEDV